MSADSNKALVRRYYEEILNKRDTSRIDELFASDYAYHITGTPPRLPHGLDGFKQFVKEFLSGYSNLQFTIDDQIVAEDKVVTRVTGRSSNIGPVQEGKPEAPETAANAGIIPGISIERIAGDKIIESWGVFDLSGMLEQLGMVPQHTKSQTGG